jgi:hypothetical protein
MTGLAGGCKRLFRRLVNQRLHEDSSVVGHLVQLKAAGLVPCFGLIRSSHLHFHSTVIQISFESAAEGPTPPPLRGARADGRSRDGRSTTHGGRPRSSEPAMAIDGSRRSIHEDDVTPTVDRRLRATPDRRVSDVAGARYGLADVRATAVPGAARAPQRPPDHPSLPSIRVSHGVLRGPDDAVGALDLLSITSTVPCSTCRPHAEPGRLRAHDRPVQAAAFGLRDLAARAFMSGAAGACRRREAR